MKFITYSTTLSKVLGDGNYHLLTGNMTGRREVSIN